MEEILQKVGLGRVVQTFTREKITPDIIGKLSLYEFESLGVKDRTEMMRLRVECSVHGTSHRPEKINKKFEIPVDVLENLLEADFRIMDICQVLSVSESTVYRQLRYNRNKNSLSKSRWPPVSHFVFPISLKVYPERKKIFSMKMRHYIKQEVEKVRT